MLRQKWILHLAFWVAYLFFKCYHEFVWIYPKYEELSWWEALYTAFFAQLSLMPPKMLFTYWVLQLVEQPARRWSLFNVLKLMGGIMVFLVLYRVNLVFVTLPLAYQEIPETQPLFALGFLSSGLVDMLLVAGLATALSLYRKHRQAEKRESQLKHEKLVNELRFLRQQTNPHFLFNTLNNLYGLARKHSPETPQALLQLAQLMRYLLYEASVPLIGLNREVEIIKDYLSLEQLRYGKRLKLLADLPEVDPVLKVAPLLLLPLVENAFKHGAAEDTGEPLVQLKLQVNGSDLYFSVVNRCVPEKADNQQTVGIGLKNLQRQLELQYPAHRLEIRKDGTQFFVALHLNLTTHENLSMPDLGR